MPVNKVARASREHEAKRILLDLLDGEAMTQEEIAREVGVSVRTVNRWCAGCAPHPKNLKDLQKLAAK